MHRLLYMNLQKVLCIIVTQGIKNFRCPWWTFRLTYFLIIFWLSVTVDIQCYISFRCTQLIWYLYNLHSDHPNKSSTHHIILSTIFLMLYFTFPWIFFSWSKLMQNRFYFFLFSYNCLHFLPIPPPYPMNIFITGNLHILIPSPFWPIHLPPSHLATIKIFSVLMRLFLFHLFICFVLFFRFHI